MSRGDGTAERLSSDLSNSFDLPPSRKIFRLASQAYDMDLPSTEYTSEDYSPAGRSSHPDSFECGKRTIESTPQYNTTGPKIATRSNFSSQSVHHPSSLISPTNPSFLPKQSKGDDLLNQFSPIDFSIHPPTDAANTLKQPHFVPFAPRLSDGEQKLLFSISQHTNNDLLRTISLMNLGWDQAHFDKVTSELASPSLEFRNQPAFSWLNISPFLGAEKKPKSPILNSKPLDRDISVSLPPPHWNPSQPLIGNTDPQSASSSPNITPVDYLKNQRLRRQQSSGAQQHLASRPKELDLSIPLSFQFAPLESAAIEERPSFFPTPPPFTFVEPYTPTSTAPSPLASGTKAPVPSPHQSHLNPSSSTPNSPLSPTSSLRPTDEGGDQSTPNRPKNMPPFHASFIEEFTNYDFSLVENLLENPYMLTPLNEVNHLNDVSYDMYRNIATYNSDACFSLGEGGRELLRKYVKFVGYKGKPLHSTSIPELLFIAQANNLWPCAIRIHLEHKKIIPFCKAHLFMRWHKSRLSENRREKTKTKYQKPVVLRSHSGTFKSIQYYDGISLQLGSAGRKELLRLIREKHDNEPEAVDNALADIGTTYGKIRDATLTHLFCMAHAIGLWEAAVDLHITHIINKTGENKWNSRQKADETAGDSSLPSVSHNASLASLATAGHIPPYHPSTATFHPHFHLPQQMQPSQSQYVVKTEYHPTQQYHSSHDYQPLSHAPYQPTLQYTQDYLTPQTQFIPSSLYNQRVSQFSRNSGQFSLDPSAQSHSLYLYPQQPGLSTSRDQSRATSVRTSSGSGVDRLSLVSGPRESQQGFGQGEPTLLLSYNNI